MKRIIFQIFLLLFLLYPASDCKGNDILGIQPPPPYGVFSTMSADSPDEGRAAFAVSMEKTGEPDIYRYSAALEMGLMNTVSIGLTIPYFDNLEDGIEDISFSLKHRFYRGEKYGPSLAYLITAALDSGTGEHSSRGNVGAGLVASKRVGPVIGHANFIYSFPGDSHLEEEVRFSAGIDFSAAHNFKVLGEIYGKKSFFSRDVDQLEARIGYRILAGEGFYATLGVGFGLGDRAPEYRVMASISLLLPRIKRPIEKVLEEG
jgi:hypothetical protein